MFQDIVTNLFAFIVVLGFLIFAHEAGHFAVAKLFRVRVLVFSFGFGKRLFGFRHGNTDYRVSAIPLGGYVRMAGDTPEENVVGQPDEFLSKPKWQRFLILFAGPSMNILIAILFFATLSMVGIEEVVRQPMIAGVEKGSPAQKAGLSAGDRIASINGERIESFDDVKLLISMNANTPLKIDYVRSGVTRTATMTPVTKDTEYGPIGFAGIVPAGIDPVLARVEAGSPAERAGLRAGDRIVAVNGKPVVALEDFMTVSNDAKTKPLQVTVARGTQSMSVTLAPAPEDSAVLRGVYPRTKLTKLSFFPALKYGVNESWRMLKVTKSALARLFRAEGSVKELSGPINIARISGDMLRRGWLYVVSLMAMISLQLGVMNLLPIPVLDGGHIMILLIEGVARRDLSLRVKERIQQLGFAVLATLMIVVLYNDVISNVLRMKNG